eukprot:m.155143 g.155143  ORF g.155143 m.155143 type:complete len:918 (+) comp30925_c0_seq1:199-2952(+)
MSTTATSVDAGVEPEGRNWASSQLDDDEDEDYEEEYMDDEDDDSDDDLEIDPNHPALQRVQVALQKQLTARKLKAENDLKIKMAQMKDTKRKREDVGVDLYTAQKVLAKAQTKLESLQDESNGSQIDRVKAEEELASAKEMHARMEARKSEVESQATEARMKADKLRITAQAVRDKASEMESELTSAIRQAEKATKKEETAEVQKQRQDLYVDRLGEIVKEKLNEIKVLKTHKEAQSDLAKESLARMNDAQNELELLKVERRETNQLWKASLLGLEKRSEARANMRKECRDQQQEVFSTITEVEKVKKELQEIQDQAELIELRRRRLDKDSSILIKTIAVTNQKAGDTQQKYSMMTKALQEAESKLGRAKQGVNILTSDNNQARQKNERISIAKKEKEKELLAVTYGKIALTKAGKAALKHIKETQTKAAEIEMRVHQVENKISREEMKIQSFEHSIALSDKHLIAQRSDVSEKVAMLRGHENEARATKIKIDRKEADIQLLQQKFDTLVAQRASQGSGRADVTPQELKRDELRENISSVIGENLQTQQLWLQGQSEYVLLMQAIEVDTAALDELQTRNTVLSQKKLRLQKEIETNESDLRRYQHSFANMQHEVVKLNTLINKNGTVKDRLESNNVLLESEFLRKLKDEELDSIQIQQELEDMADEKVRLEHDVVDGEREILEWEKKIQLAQEMKQALTSTDDVNELDAMKKEIHRMRLRLDQLARQREVLISTMEKSVEQRGTIHSKAQASSKTRGAANHNAIKKEIIGLKKRITQSKKDAEEAAANLEHVSTAVVESDMKIRQSVEQLSQMKEEAADLLERTAEMKFHRIKNLDQIVFHQNMYKHLNTVQTKQKSFKKTPEQYDVEIREQTNQLRNMQLVVEHVAQQNEDDQVATPLNDISSSIEITFETLSLNR